MTETRFVLTEWELRPSSVPVAITDTNPAHRPGIHRVTCSTFQGQRNWPVVSASVGELVFEGALERARAGLDTRANFCPMCMIRPVS